MFTQYNYDPCINELKKITDKLWYLSSTETIIIKNKILVVRLQISL
jgi:hypothetical protein